MVENTSNPPPEDLPDAMDSGTGLTESEFFDPERENSLEPFPAAPAVFAIFPRPESAPGAPYLSYTRNLRRRLGRLLGPEAARRLNLRAFAGRIEYRLVGSGFEAQWLLYRLNRTHYPETYRRRLRLKPPALIKIKLRNRFPRCYSTSRMTADGSAFYGPFPSRAAAERFAAEFLDLFKIRRCAPNLNPDPKHPGCIYSQMKMCLAPCFEGCTDEEYRRETARVIAFLDSAGESLERELEAERAQASAALEFERAAHAHRGLEKTREALRNRPALSGRISHLHAVMLFPSPQARAVTLFRVIAGELRGPATLSLSGNVSSPVPLDGRLDAALRALSEVELAKQGGGSQWEHLSLLARWFYSSFRTGEFVWTPPERPLPHARLIKLCRKIVENGSPAE